MIFNYRGKPKFFQNCQTSGRKGSAVILKNNMPRYLVIDFSKAEKEAEASDDDVSNNLEMFYRN